MAVHSAGPLDFQSRQFRNLLTRFVTVCKTLAYAHNRGIVHRDIKPRNILLGRFGETIVIDWGLAMKIERNDFLRASGEQSLLITSFGSSGSTRSGGGTPAYMSPEQLSGNALTTSSDVYSLGASLYKLLTMHAPVEEDTLHQFRERVLRGDIKRPTEHITKLPKPLEAICLKALSYEPRGRYETALALGGGFGALPQRRTGPGVSGNARAARVPLVAEAPFGHTHRRRGRGGDSVDHQHLRHRHRRPGA